jgi:hypothetical protein
VICRTDPPGSSHLSVVTRTTKARWAGLLEILLSFTAACSDSSGDETANATDGSDSGGESVGTTTDAPADDGEGSTSGTSAADGDSTDGATGDTGHDTGGGHGDDLPYDPDQLARVCERNNGDPIAQALCAEPTPAFDDIVGLYDALGLQLIPAHFAVLSNSTSLAARSVSVINPRVMVIVPFEIGIGAVTYSRGEQVVEMVGYDQAADELNFYLFTFFRDCNDTEAGCGLADLVTPAVESDWTKWSLYQDVDLENRPLDCLTCHQPQGPGTEKLLLAHQAEEPWMHWFPSLALSQPGDTQSSTILTPRFLEIHGGEERFAGIPVELLTPPNPAAAGIVLQQLLDNYWFPKGGPPPGMTAHGQPHEFDSAAIEADISGGSTATWDQYYADTLTGDRLPVPHHSHDITDPAKRAAAVESYVNVLSGAADPDTLVDPRDVLTEETEVELGFRPRPNATAEEILHHVCQRCHNDELDQTLSRAKFNAERPAELTPAQKTTAISRLMEPDGSPNQMPPPRFATLSDAQKQTMIEFLQE